MTRPKRWLLPLGYGTFQVGPTKLNDTGEAEIAIRGPFLPKKVGEPIYYEDGLEPAPQNKIVFGGSDPLKAIEVMMVHLRFARELLIEARREKINQELEQEEVRYENQSSRAFR